MRKQWSRLSDALNWALMIDPATVLTKGGELMTCIEYIPRDMASSSPEQLVSARAALNAAVKRFGGGWALWFTCTRTESTEYPAAEFPDAVSQAIDEERRRLFETAGTQFHNQYVVTLLYGPPSDPEMRLLGTFDENSGGNAEEKQHGKQVVTFRAGVEEFRLHMADIMPMVQPLTGGRLITYLHRLISTNKDQLAEPPVPIFLSEYLTDDTFVPGIYPRLGVHHLRVVRVNDQPEMLTPGILDEINSLPFPFHHSCRWLPYSREEADRVLTARRDAWLSQRKSFLTRIINNVVKSNDDGAKDNLHATRCAAQTAAALAFHATGGATFGEWSHTITLTDPDRDVVEDRCRIVRQIFRGFVTSVVEDDSMSAWLGAVPGHPHADLSRFLGPSIGFASVVPSTAPWAGPERDYHLDGPPLLHCLSDGATAFRMALHQPGSDLGHTLVLGESGGGKSTLLKAMLAGHRKYPGSRVFVIDRGAVSKLPVLALGGTFHALDGGDAAVSLQPLAFIDDPDELIWAGEFVAGLLNLQDVKVTPRHRAEISSALTNLAGMPAVFRTLTHLRLAVQDSAVRQALAVYCIGGAAGHLLDNDSHACGAESDIRGFETDKLLENKTALPAVIAVLMHEVARTYSDQRPTMLVIDECKELITNPLVAWNMDEIIRRGRRENLHVILATHSMIDIDDSAIAPIIKSSFKNRIFTANGAAQERDTANALANIGLTSTQIEIIANLRPKREYVFSCPMGWRKFELCLSDYEKAFLCGGSGEESKTIDRIYASGPRESFAERWLIHKGLIAHTLSLAAE